MARVRISPKTEHLEKVLEARIRQGMYAAGSRMPTERRTAAELGCARHTVRKAYQALNHRGLLVYRNRTFTVNSDMDGLEWPKQKSEAKNYAILLHSSDFDEGLHCALEKAVRSHGCSPVSFSMDSMEPDSGGRMDLISYLHFRVAGIFFLSTVYGTSKKELEKRMLDTLPLPYLFVGREPCFLTPRALGLDPEASAQRLAQFVRSGGYRFVELCFPWPMREAEALLLQRISAESAALQAKGVAMRPRLMAPEAGLPPELQGRRRLVVLGQRLGHLWERRMKGDVLVIGNSRHRGGAAVMECPKELLAGRAFQVLSGGQDLSLCRTGVAPGPVAAGGPAGK